MGASTNIRYDVEEELRIAAAACRLHTSHEVEDDCRSHLQ